MPNDEFLAPEGRVLDSMLSEHQCEGRLAARPAPGSDYVGRGVPYGPDDGTLAPWALVASLTRRS